MRDLTVVLTSPETRDQANLAATRISDAGFRVREVACQTPDDAREHAAHHVAEGAATIAVAGGDPFVHAALQEIARSHTALAVLPVGPGHRIAASLGLSASLEAAADVVVGSRITQFDLGRAGGTWFVTRLTAGFDGRRREARRAKANQYRVSAPSGDVLATAVAIEVRLAGEGLLEASAFDSRGDIVARRPSPLIRAAEVALAAPSATAWADGIRLGPLPIHITVEPAALRIITA